MVYKSGLIKGWFFPVHDFKDIIVHHNTHALLVIEWNNDVQILNELAIGFMFGKNSRCILRDGLAGVIPLLKVLDLTKKSY